MIVAIMGSRMRVIDDKKKNNNRKMQSGDERRAAAPRASKRTQVRGETSVVLVDVFGDNCC